jgi:hypothetical protein
MSVALDWHERHVGMPPSARQLIEFVSVIDGVITLHVGNSM